MIKLGSLIMSEVDPNGYPDRHFGDMGQIPSEKIVYTEWGHIVEIRAI